MLAMSWWEWVGCGRKWVVVGGSGGGGTGARWRQSEVGDAGGRISAANAPPLEQKQSQLPNHTRVGRFASRRWQKDFKEVWEHHQLKSQIHCTFRLDYCIECMQ